MSNQDKKQTRRAEIERAAIELFTDRGYDGTSISEIAKRAGISKGLMYNYFESKEALLANIFKSGMESLGTAIFSDPPGDSEDPLLHAVRQYFDTLASDVSYWKMFYSLLAMPWIAKLFANEYEQFYVAYYCGFERIFRRKGSAEPELSAKMFIAMLDGLAIYYLFYPGMYSSDEIIRYIGNIY